MPTLSFTKHHGLGNDFLVLVDLEDRCPLDPATVLRVCDRHTGVGADGIIRVLSGRGGALVSMELHNSDASRAAMSGNGIRCLVQAVLGAGIGGGPRFEVATDCGVRAVTALPGGNRATIQVRVGMGRVEVGEELDSSEVPGRRARPVDVGNPHVVVLEPELECLDLALDGSRTSRSHRSANVEFVDLAGEDVVRIRTWERGAGETLACGTGSVAAAAAARAWGLVGELVRVENPGGSLAVDISGEEAVLEGPAEFVARVEVEVP